MPPAPLPLPPRAAWLQRLARRPPVLWPVKAIGTMVGIPAFFLLYFWVMRHPAAGTLVHAMPVTPVDRFFEVHEWAVVPYASLWFYVAIAPALARDAAGLAAYGRSALALCAAGLLCFWLFPTAVPPVDIDWNEYPALAFLKAQDTGTNAFPSLHVAFAVHTAVFLRRALREVGAPARVQALNLAWALLIVHSVFATRQHVLVDVLGGVAAGLAAAWLVRARRPEPIAGDPSVIIP